MAKWVLALPVRRRISAVPHPSAVSKTILARQTCFCRLLRFATTVHSRVRSAAIISTTIPVRIAQARTLDGSWESRPELFRQALSTRFRFLLWAKRHSSQGSCCVLDAEQVEAPGWEIEVEAAGGEVVARAAITRRAEQVDQIVRAAADVA